MVVLRVCRATHTSVPSSSAYAQEATIAGTVVGWWATMLPGVTVYRHSVDRTALR